MPSRQQEATIEVVGQQVSMTVYWCAVELCQRYESDEKIIAAILPLLASKNYMKARSIVDGIKQNLILMQNESYKINSNVKYNHNAGHFSTYRQERQRTRLDLEIAMSKIGRAVAEEKQLTCEIFNLKRLNDKDNATHQLRWEESKARNRIQGQIIALQEQRDDVRRQIASLEQIIDINQEFLA